MAKGGRAARTALDELKEYANSLAPQRGFFSTLDELVQQAPFERAPAEQWRGYLQPGRMLKREGMQFPLKKEELEYAFDPAMRTTFGERAATDTFTKEQILEAMRTQRMPFRQGVNRPQATAEENAEIHERLTGLRPPSQGRLATHLAEYGPDTDPRLSHQSPDSTYEESTSRVEGLNYPGHFTPDTLSWSRTSQHQLPTGERMRLIEEIQSDLHEAAAERVGDINSQHGLRDMLKRRGHWANYNEVQTRESELLQRRYEKGDSPELNAEINKLRAEKQEMVDDAYENRPRRGYRTAEDEALIGTGVPTDPDISTFQRYQATHEKVPDAPFKNPEDYAQLELRKQLLNAANNDEDYLALVRGRDQMERYGMDDEAAEEAQGMQYIYDKIYPSVLRRLARQYGAEVVDVEAPVGSATDTRPQWMRRDGHETPEDFRTSASFDHKVHPGDVATDTLENYREAFEQIDPTGDLGLVKKLEQLELINEDRLEPPHELYDFGSDWNYLVKRAGDALESQLQSIATSETKSFPALRLTPEVRERIKRVGVPLWALGAGAVGLEALQGDDAQAEEPEGMAKGGKVTLDELKTLVEAIRKKQQAIQELDVRLLPSGDVRLDTMAANPTGTGAGSAAMQDLVNFADENEIRMVLGLADKGYQPIEVGPRTTSRNRLKSFYRRFGFVPNQGRNKDYQLSLYDSMYRRPKPQKKAEGGKIVPKAADSIEALKRVAYGLGTQALPYDPETGELRGPRPRRTFSGKWVVGTGGDTREISPEEAQAMLERHDRGTVGLVEETIALPTFFGAPGPERSVEANERSQRVSDYIRGGMDLSEPNTLPEYAAESLGIMLGQAPMMGPTVARGAVQAGGGALARAGRLLKKAPAAVAEWFFPTVSPSVGKYATGAGAGALIQKYLPEFIESMAPGDDPWALATEIAGSSPGAIEKSGRLEPELAFAIANHLDPQLPPGDMTPEMAEEMLAILGDQ